MKHQVSAGFLSVVLMLMCASVNANQAFDMVELRSERLDAFPQWQRVMKEHHEFVEQLNECVQDCDDPWVKRWKNIKALSSHKASMQTLALVNEYFNNWEYIDDQKNWGRSDWWTAPRIFMERSGDCEDYAISKYYALQKLGFSSRQLRILVVRDVYRKLAHAVLMVELPDQTVILDSLSDPVLKPSQVLQYAPVYSLNEDFRWLHFKASKLTKGAQL